MSCTGCCCDHAVLDRFHGSLQHEGTRHECFADLEAARLRVFKYIELFYNTERLHQTLGYPSPKPFEIACAPATAA